MGLGFHIFLFDLLEDFHQESSEASSRLPVEVCGMYQNQNRSRRQDSVFPLCGLALGP